jgi:hypothetical protein
MEKKLTNSGPLREPADKHSIYTIKTWRHGRSRGRPPVPVCIGSRKVSRMARMEDTKPSGQTNRGRWAAHPATVRSSEPNATAVAWRGHPWASSVTTRRTVSAEVRRR